jgi:hypothetical protein
MLLLRKNTGTHPLRHRVALLECGGQDIGDVSLVLSLCCSTGVLVGAFGSESTLYMVYFIYCNGNIGGWNPLWKIIGGNLSGL